MELMVMGGGMAVAAMVFFFIFKDTKIMPSAV
jgi:hypothetical protein